MNMKRHSVVLVNDAEDAKANQPAKVKEEVFKGLKENKITSEHPTGRRSKVWIQFAHPRKDSQLIQISQNAKIAIK